MVYKWCVVPQCRSTSIKTPEKLFLPVPMDPKKRKKWLELARRHPNSIGANSSVSMCEDHFEIENDVANYMKYKMGFTQKVLVKDGVLPAKFSCQQDCKRSPTDAGTSRGACVKRQRMELVSEGVKENLLRVKTCKQIRENVTRQKKNAQPEQIPKTQDKETITDSIVTAEKCVQIAMKVHYKNKSVQTSTSKKDVFTSPENQ